MWLETWRFRLDVSGSNRKAAKLLSGGCYLVCLFVINWLWYRQKAWPSMAILLSSPPPFLANPQRWIKQMCCIRTHAVDADLLALCISIRLRVVVDLMCTNLFRLLQSKLCIEISNQCVTLSLSFFTFHVLRHRFLRPPLVHHWIPVELFCILCYSIAEREARKNSKRANLLLLRYQCNILLVCELFFFFFVFDFSLFCFFYCEING